MNAEEQLQKARVNRDQLDKTQLRRARITALVLASATIISLIFLVAAFIYKQEADKVKHELSLTKQELENCQSNK